MEISNLVRSGRVWISSRQSVAAALSQMAKAHLPGMVVMEHGRIRGVTTLMDLASLHPNRIILDTCIRESVPLPAVMDIESAWQATSQNEAGIHPVIDQAGNMKGVLIREDLREFVFNIRDKTEAPRSRFCNNYILVAGPDDAVRRLLSSFLKDGGYRVVTASNGAGVKGRIKLEIPGLVLLDADLPGNEGYEILKEIKADPLIQSRPVIMMMCSTNDIESRNRLFEAGADDFLYKPFAEKEIQLRIRQHLPPDPPARTSVQKFSCSAGPYDTPDINDLILENMGCGLFVLDNRGDISAYNPVAANILLIPPEKDLTGLPITDIHPGLAAFKKVTDSHRTSLIVKYPVAPDKTICLGFISSHLYDRDGKRRGTVIVFVDLRERQEQHEKPDRRDATLQALMNATTERMLLTDINGDILAANHVFAESLGRDLSLLIGTCVWDHLPPDLVRTRKLYVEKMIETGQPVCFEDFRGGRYLESSIYPVLDSQGQVELVATFSRDVTEMKLSTMRLEKEQEEVLILKNLLENIMGNMMTGLLVIDDRGKILQINRSAQESLETTAECQGWPIETLSSDLVAFKQVHSREVSGHEVEVRLANGHIKPLGFNSTHFQVPNGKNGVITVFKDLTEIKETQKVLKEKERLALIGELSRHIVHEIKNPLFSISASLQILEQKLKSFNETGDNQDDVAVKLFGILYSETERINRLLDMLSQMGKNQVLHPGLVDFENLIEFVLLENTGLITEKSIRINRCFSKPIKGFRADRDKIIQIITNLVLNAISFSPEGGGITLALQKGAQEASVCFCVGDEGPGIAEEDLEKIYEPFFSKREGGSGMGLAITRSLVELHGGKIIVKSQKNNGALFVVTLPGAKKGDE